MIKTLRLFGFGKYRQAEFALAPVTIVFGPNEAGKTTFFDGLFQALCRPSETKKPGRDLKQRYGVARKAEAVLMPGADSVFGDDEFLNLYAIRAGDLNLELNQGSDWLQKLKSALFHGGIDPAAMAKEFDKRSSASRTLAHNKELEKAQAAAAKAREELDQRRREREACLSQELALREAESGLADLRARIAAIGAELEEAERKSAFEERILQRQRWAARLAAIEDRNKAEEALRGLFGFREDKRAEWEALDASARKVAERIQAESGKRELLAESMFKAKGEARALRDRRDALGPRLETARRLLQEARALAAAMQKPVRPGAMSLGLGASALLLSALAVWGLRGSAAAASLAAALGLILASLSIYLGFKRASADAHVSVQSALSRWKDQWTLASARDAHGADAAEPDPRASADLSGISTVEGFAEAMDQALRQGEALAAKESEALRRAEAWQADLDKLDADLAALRSQEETARRAEREWLRGHSVANAEEYILKVTRYRQLEAETAKAEPAKSGARAEAVRAGSGGPAPQAETAQAQIEGERRELLRKLQASDEEGVPAQGLDESGLQRLRRSVQELKDGKEKLAREELAALGRKENQAGGILATLGRLAGESVAWEERLAEAEAQVRALELDKHAAIMAAEIFRGLGDGADLMLAELAREIESMLTFILPERRKVSLSGLEAKALQIDDAGGAARALEHLSTGTRDAAVLSARLALARKHREGPGLLVLDEPFLAMDETRENRALELLRDFHIRYGWQLILMTKQARLKDLCLSLFPDAGLIDLGLKARA